MAKSPAEKDASTIVAIALGVLLWAGLMALFLIPTWNADIDPSGRIGIAGGITWAAVWATRRWVEVA